MTSSAISAARPELAMPIHQHMVAPAPVHPAGCTRDPVMTGIEPSVTSALADDALDRRPVVLDEAEVAATAAGRTLQ